MSFYLYYTAGKIGIQGCRIAYRFEIVMAFLKFACYNRIGGGLMPAKNYAYVNKEMLVWARGETPFVTPEAAASYLSGISSEQIASWECGTDCPSITEAKKLASLLLR